MNYKPRNRVISWDIKEQPDIDALNKILAPYGICARDFDDGSDNYNLVFGQIGMSQEDAERVFKNETGKCEENL